MPQTSTSPEPKEESFVDDTGYPDGGLRACLVVVGVNTHTAQVFQAYYQLHLLKNETPSAMSMALTFGLAIFMGRLFDNGWFALPAALASVCLIVFTILIGECVEFWQFLLCQGFAVGLACGVIFGPTLAIVSHWFKRRRSTALGIVAAGSSGRWIIVPILVQRLIPQIGFRWTLRVLALFLFFTTGIMNLCLRRRLDPIHTSGGIFNFAAFKSKPFYLYTLAVFVCFFGLYTLLTYIDVSATSAGIDPSFDVYLLSFANAASGVAAGSMSVMIPGTFLAAILTYAWPYAKDLGSLVAIAIMYGFASGVFLSLQAVPLIHMGSIPDVGRRIGTLFSVLAISALAGPPISGAIAGRTGGYVAVGWYAGSVIMVALGLLWYVRYLMTGKIVGGRF
ncbi:MFS general substrate transporter [Roridomyces roridus]|uniref:MFS general substrate transporter n=1 Tax=Roridomyces roridus TaxID=1738132 RepID=A0AAD7BSJ6_9AGAR|nr:MFS general substrate transporter [Roridomyces roridus]